MNLHKYYLQAQNNWVLVKQSSGLKVSQTKAIRALGPEKPPWLKLTSSCFTRLKDK